MKCVDMATLLEKSLEAVSPLFLSPLSHVLIVLSSSF